MNRILLLFFSFLLIFNTAYADEFVVKDFKLDIADLSARKAEIKDFNGDVCAIIKILTDIPGLKFDANISITHQEFKNGSYRLFVSPTERKLTIMKDGFIPLEYVLPLKIESNNVYVMILTRQSAEVIKNTNTTGLILLKTEPDKADVRINGEFKGKTPFQLELAEGKYNYKLSKSLFHSFEGSFEIKANETTKPEPIKLLKNYGSLNIKTLPEDGVEIEIDQKPINAKSPYIIDLLPSGEHELGLSKDMYEPVSIPFAIEDNAQTPLTITMTPVFGTININANPLAEIYIDGNLMAKGNFKGRLVKGMHTIEIKLDKYYTQTIKQDIQINKNENLSIDLKPKLGLLMVMSAKPEEANLYIDGKLYGNTPLIVKDLLIGSHTIKLEKEGFKPLTKTIEIIENEKVTEQLELFPIEETSQSLPGAGAGAGVTFNGYKYSSIVMGNGQEWMAENLRTDRYRNGELIPNVTRRIKWENIKSGAWAHYDNNSQYENPYGKLYNWYAVSDNRNLCPQGWHVPSDDELTKLINYLGGEIVAGGKMKSTQYWQSSEENATNESGFTALPAGLRSHNGIFFFIVKYCGWWSSTEYTSGNAWSRGLIFTNGISARGSSIKGLGFSVRCLRD